MDEIDAIASNGGLARGVPTGFTELDEVTNGLHPGQMIIVAAGPGSGNRPWDWISCGRARSSTGWPASSSRLEMSKSEIIMRLLSAEAKIKLGDMRSGQMSDHDWTRLARRIERNQRGAAVHRRLAEPDDDGDPRQSAAAEAEG